MRISEPPGNDGAFTRLSPVRRQRRRDPKLRFAADVALPQVLFELVQVGGHVRCAAIDPITNTEVVVVGSVRQTETEIKQVAVQKLEYVLRKRRDGRWSGL